MPTCFCLHQGKYKMVAFGLFDIKVGKDSHDQNEQIHVSSLDSLKALTHQGDSRPSGIFRECQWL